MDINFKKLFKSIIIPLLAGGVASFLTMNAMDTFEKLNQPALSPPGWVFPVVWTILYTLMGISLYLVNESGGTESDKVNSRRLFYVQLAVNFLWPIFFFNFNWFLFSFIWLVFLWVLIVIMIKRFADVNKLAGYLNIPYLLWITFAGYLNFAIWMLNK